MEILKLKNIKWILQNDLHNEVKRNMTLDTDVSSGVYWHKLKLNVGIYHQSTSPNTGIRTNQVRSSTMGVDIYHV